MESRNILSFRDLVYGPYTIRIMDGASAPLLVSIEGPGIPTLRLTPDGPKECTDDLSAPVLDLPRGHIVFGSYHGNRPQITPAEPEPKLDDVMQIRIDPGLKDWVMANGGHKMVRILLRTERDRWANEA